MKPESGCSGPPQPPNQESSPKMNQPQPDSHHGDKTDRDALRATGNKKSRSGYA